MMHGSVESHKGSVLPLFKLKLLVSRDIRNLYHFTIAIIKDQSISLDYDMTRLE